jgi:hypothetical protein
MFDGSGAKKCQTQTRGVAVVPKNIRLALFRFYFGYFYHFVRLPPEAFVRAKGLTYAVA